MLTGMLVEFVMSVIFFFFNTFIYLAVSGVLVVA